MLCSKVASAADSSGRSSSSTSCSCNFLLFLFLVGGFCGFLRWYHITNCYSSPPRLATTTRAVFKCVCVCLGVCVTYWFYNFLCSWRRSWVPPLPLCCGGFHVSVTVAQQFLRRRCRPLFWSAINFLTTLSSSPTLLSACPAIRRVLPVFASNQFLVANEIATLRDVVFWYLLLLISIECAHHGDRSYWIEHWV